MTSKSLKDQSDKFEYLIHIRLLKFVVVIGIKFTKVHRIIIFKQDYIIKNYLEQNTKIRTEAETRAEKNIFKLLKFLYLVKFWKAIKVIRS